MNEPQLTAPTRLETARLVLRRPRLGDEEALIALDSEPDVLEYLTTRGADPTDIAGRVRARIATAEAEPSATYGWWVIEGREDGVFHGRGLLAPLWEGADVEVGIYLRRASRRKGFATEAATALLDHAFFDLGLPRVIGVTQGHRRARTRQSAASQPSRQDLPLRHRGRPLRHHLPRLAAQETVTIPITHP